MARRSRRLSVQSAMKRRTTWARFSNTVTLTTTGSYANTDLLAAFKADGGVTQGVTIARTHISISVEDAPDAGDQFAWGLLRGQNTDAGANIAGAPNPLDDPYEDWAMWDTRAASVGPGGGAAYFPGNGNQWTYDIKSQRKIPELQMAWLASFVNISGTDPITFGVTGSVLLLLP